MSTSRRTVVQAELMNAVETAVLAHVVARAAHFGKDVTTRRISDRMLLVSGRDESMAPVNVRLTIVQED